MDLGRVLPHDGPGSCSGKPLGRSPATYRADECGWIADAELTRKLKALRCKKIHRERRRRTVVPYRDQNKTDDLTMPYMESLLPDAPPCDRSESDHPIDAPSVPKPSGFGTFMM